MKKIVIVGASSLIAQKCAELWLKTPPVQLILIGRQKDKIDRIAFDLRVRNPHSSIHVVIINFLNHDSIKLNIEKICLEGVPDIVLIAQGILSDEKLYQNDLGLIEKLVLINSVSPVYFTECFLRFMASSNNICKLAIIGSVAGDRGKKSNNIYGASKGFLEIYVQGLQHRLVKSKVLVSIIKPGPTKTPMTKKLVHNSNLFASPELVAKSIVFGIDKNKETIYAPFKWKYIMFIIKILPIYLFKRLNI